MLPAALSVARRHERHREETGRAQMRRHRSAPSALQPLRPPNALRLAAQYPATHPPAYFVVLKGYHEGSKWFEEAFNAVPGCSFFFETTYLLTRKATPPSDGE